jgi:hypothetical protein
MLRFDSDFNFFLPVAQRGRPFEITPGHVTTIKDLGELFGVLYTELGVLRR